MTIIVFDTETTGLLAPVAAGIEHQPFLVEFHGIKLNDNFDLIDTLSFRVKPPIPIPEGAIKVHKITDADVAECKPFASYFLTLAEFFFGTEIYVCHNVSFDRMILYWELYRIGMTLNFPWPIKSICTVETCVQQFGSRRNLTDLHIELFGQGFDGSHSAMNDCQATANCFVELVKQGAIVL